MAVIRSLDVIDVRFPTSESLAGSDAMFADPDYSASYITLRAQGDLEGHALVFTIGRGNDVQAEAIRSLERQVVGFDVGELMEDPGSLYRRMKGDSQLHWLGPEKGIIQMAIGGVVNAGWDLISRAAGKPMWKYLADLSPEQIVQAADLTYLRDALTPEDALHLLRMQRRAALSAERQLLDDGVPAYTTSPGWLGYDDSTLIRLVNESIVAGFHTLKLKVGQDPLRDLHRVETVRRVAPPGTRIALDANQVWEVPEAIERIAALAHLDPLWIEEPTSPDDVLGHAAIRSAVTPIRIATGEHASNRVMFKQFLQAGAIDILQLDVARVGGVNELIAILLLAARFHVPVVPHAGGVGLCEMVQHLAMFDAVAVSGSRSDRLLEYVDHLHEHFVHPVRIVDAAYQAPLMPGFGAEMHSSSLSDFEFPSGTYWRGRLAP